MRRLQFCLLVCSMAVLTAAAPAQQNRVGIFNLPPTVTLYAGLYLGDEELQDELKMTAEQREKALALLDSSFDRLLECTRADARRRDAVSKTQEAALAKVLRPEQLKRLHQVVLQHLARIPAGPPTLAEDAALAQRLKLDDSQRKKLLERKPIAEVLSAEQKEEWARVVGKSYPRRLLMQGVKGLQYRPLPTEIGWLLSDPVEVELKLTAEQLARLEEIAGKWGDALPDAYWMTEPLAKALTTEALAVLTPAQRKRYAQLKWQYYYSLQPTQLYGVPDVIEGLKLTPEQRQSRARLLKEMGKAALKMIADTEKVADLPPKLKKLEEEMEEKWQAILTPKQRDMLKEMLGNPVNLKAFEYSRIPSLPWEKRERPFRPSHLLLEALRHADNPLFHREVKASEEQVRKLKALKDRVAKETASAAKPEAEERLQERAVAVGKELAVILDAAQLRRWKELTYRQLAGTAYSVSHVPPELLGVEEFRTGLKLSDGQLRRLQRGALLSSVLDAEQKKTASKLFGKPIAVESYGPTVWSAPHSNPIVTEQLRVIMAPLVQNILELTAAQKKMLTEMEARAKALPFISRADANAWWKAVEKRRSEHHAAIARVLDEKQNRRWKQIACSQIVSPQNQIHGLLSISEIQEELKLTPEQKAHLKAIYAEQMELHNHIGRLSSLCRLDGPETIRALRIPVDRTEKEVRKLLSVEQSAALKDEILGKQLGYITVYDRNGFEPR